MKRPVIIIVGVVLVLVLLGLWVYMLFFAGTENTPDTFTDLSFEDTTDTSVTVTQNTTPEEPIVDVSSTEKLRQLTTTPVIGFSEVKHSTSSSLEVRYIEPGTGHIFSIDLSTGEEKRVSGTTIPSASMGVITSDGKFAMIKSGSGASSKFISGALSSTSDAMETTDIRDKVLSFTPTSDNTFLYTTRVNGGVEGKEYFPDSNTTETVFTLPFNEVIMDWGVDSESTHYAYPKPNSKLEGYLYAISSSNITRLPVSGYGLSAKSFGDSVIYSTQTDGYYKTNYLNTSDLATTESLVDHLPEKCTPTETRLSFICAVPNSTKGNKLPDSWYEGATSFSDSIWEISPSFGSATFWVDVEDESGRELDIINLRAGENDGNIYFQNKNDQTLWLYSFSSEDTTF